MIENISYRHNNNYNIIKELSMKDSKFTEKQFMRTLDDTQCSNIIIAKNIRRLVGKFPNMKKIAIDCWVHDGHYTEFELQGSNLVWRHDKNRKCTNGD